MKKDKKGGFKGRRDGFKPSGFNKGSQGRRDQETDRRSGGRDGAKRDASSPQAKTGRTSRPAPGRHPDKRYQEKPAIVSARPARPKAEPKFIKPAAQPRLKIDLFGGHAVMAALQNPRRQIRALYVTAQAEETFNIEALPDSVAVTKVQREQLDRSLPPGSVHQGIALACDPLPEIGIDDMMIQSASRSKSVFLMLDQVTDPHNVGAILRSACAFGVQGVVMQRKHAPELTGVLAKTACGAVEHVPAAYETNLSRALETFKDHGFTVVGLDEHATASFGHVSSFDKIVLVLGAEGDGMRRLIKEQCDHLVSLPTSGVIASLNVSNAAAVALYAITHTR
ncbi:MAG: 23S rRNA (guanosine(2251)-2'-O)-methyltransferase RlmB [Alphaproteobacteria bacterium]|nr:23S rRNA (guanosine(2251)-2'-O)-methyltransferase RlmB [Alphaproteobacteria bacterium]